jgi:hypothetical protein
MFFALRGVTAFLILILLVKCPYSGATLNISRRWRVMLQKLSTDIRECYLHAQQCRRWAEIEPTSRAKTDFLDMERRWLSLARSYEFAELLSESAPQRKARRRF